MIKCYLKSLVAVRQLIRQVFSPCFVPLSVSIIIVLILCIGVASKSRVDIGSFWNIIIALSVLFVGQALLVFRMQDDYFTYQMLNHLRFYKLSNFDIVLLGLLQALPLAVLTGIQTLLLCTFFNYEGKLILVAALYSILHILVSATYLTFRAVRQQHRPRRKAIQLFNCVHTKLLRSKDSALLLRDFLTLNRSTLFFELPFLTILSVGVFLIGQFFNYANTTWYMRLICSYFSYILILTAVLSTSTDAEYKRVQSFHLSLFRLFPNQLMKSLRKRLILSSVMMMLIHWTVSVCWFDSPFYRIVVDLIALIVVFITLQALIYFCLWLVYKGVMISSLMEFFIAVAAFIFPLGLLLGVRSRLRIKKLGLWHA